jgi:O-antigen/teichoic acid export membrane protein
MIRPFLARAQKSVLMRNAAWLFAGQGLSFVAQGFCFIVLARLIGTTQYGLLGGAGALIGIVSQYTSLGSGLLFLRYVSADPAASVSTGEMFRCRSVCWVSCWRWGFGSRGAVWWA